ncbi:hypothetical protein GGR57DRAFT_199349 [Xylariaceae sp. FL1272]|nr:hypothetical protein GGR57DRAFT_199349 [Xylariaceae sp. FL1272]
MYTHVVAFQFNAGSPPELVKELVDRMSALKETCLHPKAGKPYIISASGGVDNSVQGLQNGLTHVFLVNFACKEDRDYYAIEDPVHLEFVKWSENVVSQVLAIDYVEGEFGDYTI